MQSKPPVIVLDLFSEERAGLLALLTKLPADAWHAPTMCAGWSVKDVAAHILADDLRNLSGGRDRYTSPDTPFKPNSSWDDLVSAVNRFNERWVQAARRLSPRLLTELLAWSGERTLSYFRALDPMAPGWPVSWAGPDPAPNWLHIAREYTERWTHQEQIRQAIDAPGLRHRQLFFPVLNTFVHALPHSYGNVRAPEGTHVRLTITGESGGDWALVHHDGVWGLYDAVVLPPTATVTMDEDTAWRLFTKGIDRDAAQDKLKVEGEQALTRVLLNTVAIIA